MNWYSLYEQGFARVAACTIMTAIADPASNLASIVDAARGAHHDGAVLAVFPELALTGYAIDDLVMQDAVLDAAEAAVGELITASEELRPVLVVGVPLRLGHRLYNCAVVVHRGRLLGVVPKTYLPTYREFYEARHYASGADVSGSVEVAGHLAPAGNDLIFRAADLPGFALHVEICEDMWVPVPPSSLAALGGATVLANLSGSPITVGRARDRHVLAQSASARDLAAYLYAAAGVGESTTDLSWDGQAMAYECGDLLVESERFAPTGQTITADIDLDRLRQERVRQGSFNDNAVALGVDGAFREVTFAVEPPTGDLGLRRHVDRFPFVPDNEELLDQDCYEAYSIQVAGLKQRLSAIGQPKIVIGVSGGLDSTQALLVAARAMDELGRPRTDILAYTMPGFATSDHTKSNATRLCEELGVSFDVLDITPAARQMLADIDHPYSGGESVYDVTFENVQAGLRTDYLFRIANHTGGIVLGTGDMSELALGWCTYGVGDQMSHYGVNAGIPKTMIQHLIRWVIARGFFSDATGEVLESILGTEITPELIPAGEGETPQSTQAVIGPYELQDFNLFWTLRYGLRPSRIAFLAWHAWRDASVGGWPRGIEGDARNAYDLATIRKWLEVFCKRFFGFAQFKRSALPNGPKVVHGGALSPRGDWRAPSDGNARAWLADLARTPDA